MGSQEHLRLQKGRLVLFHRSFLLYKWDFPEGHAFQRDNEFVQDSQKETCSQSHKQLLQQSKSVFLTLKRQKKNFLRKNLWIIFCWFLGEFCLFSVIYFSVKFITNSFNNIKGFKFLFSKNHLFVEVSKIEILRIFCPQEVKKSFNFIFTLSGSMVRAVLSLIIQSSFSSIFPICTGNPAAILLIIQKASLRNRFWLLRVSSNIFGRNCGKLRTS